MAARPASDATEELQRRLLRELFCGRRRAAARTAPLTTVVVLRSAILTCPHGSPPSRSLSVRSRPSWWSLEVRLGRRGVYPVPRETGVCPSARPVSTSHGIWPGSYHAEASDCRPCAGTHALRSPGRWRAPPQYRPGQPPSCTGPAQQDDRYRGLLTTSPYAPAKRARDPRRRFGLSLTASDHSHMIVTSACSPKPAPTRSTAAPALHPPGLRPSWAQPCPLCRITPAD